MSSDSDSSQDGFATKTTDKGARWEDQIVTFVVVVYDSLVEIKDKHTVNISYVFQNEINAYHSKCN